MLGIVLVLLLYSVAITVAVVVTTVSKDTYYKKYRALEDELRRIKASGSIPSETLAPAPAPETPAPQPPQTVNKPVQSAPAPASLPTYTYQNSAPRQKKSGPTAVGVSFSVGVLLMVIAAAVFISATWQTMLPLFKCIVLLLVVAGVYALSTLSRKKLKLEKTSSVLYMLGSLITPLAVFVGFLAFDVKETLITLVCCTLALGISGFIGYKIFGSKLQVAISYLGFVWSEIFICMQVMGNLKGMAFGMCLAAFASGLIYYLKPKLKFFNVFAEVTAYTAVIGLFMSTVFESSEVVLLLLSQVMYWVSLILLTRKRSIIRYFSALVPVFTLLSIDIIELYGRNVFAIVSMCWIVALFVIYKLIKHENPASNAIISVGISLMLRFSIPFMNFDEPIHDLLYYTTLIVPVLCFAYVIISSKFKAERAVYWYLEFFSLIILCNELLHGTVPIMIFLAIAAASVFANFKLKQMNLQFASIAASVIVLLTNLTRINADMVSVIYAAVTLLVYGAVVLINKYKDLGKKVFLMAKYSVLLPVIIGNLIVLVRGFNNDVCLAALIIMDVIFTVITLIDTDNYVGIAPLITFTIGVMYKLVDIDVNSAFISAVFVAVYVIIGRIFVCEKIHSKNRIDWFTCIAVLCCFIPVADWSSSLIIITFYILSFIGRFGEQGASLEEKIQTKLRIILSAATGSFALCMATLDVELSSVMDLEIRLMIILVAALLVYLVIRPGSAARWIWFTAVAACIEIEAIHALFERDLLPLTLISICSIGIFIYSFIGKKRSWFILSIASIFQFALLFALVFWDSTLWWIYLLVIGGILIATASTNEYKRRRAIESGLEDKKIRLFEDWTW